MHLSIHFQLLNFFRKQARSGKHQQETRNIPTDVVRSSISSPHPTHEKEEPASSKHSGDKQQHTSSKLEGLFDQLRIAVKAWLHKSFTVDPQIKIPLLLFCGLENSCLVGILIYEFCLLKIIKI
jgi:hypothetical protein